MEEEYVEVQDEDYYEDDDFSFGDAAFLTFAVILICGVFAFVIKVISKYLKNVKLKIGNKIELGVESKEEKDEIQKNTI